MDKHTPGPWELELQKTSAVFTAIGEPVAVVGGEATGEDVEFVIGRLCDYGEHGVEQTTANAHLVAASPDLLEACKAMAGVVEGFPDMISEPSVKACYDMAVAAIAKAEGKA